MGGQWARRREASGDVDTSRCCWIGWMMETLRVVVVFSPVCGVCERQPASSGGESRAPKLELGASSAEYPCFDPMTVRVLRLGSNPDRAASRPKRAVAT